jgi:hypothetical protein
MSRRPAPKRIRYVRATYNKNTAPKDSLEFLVRDALCKLGGVKDTQIDIGNLGTVTVRKRNETPLMLALGAGAKGEHMSTLGLEVSSIADDDVPEAPPINRAFKNADAYLLIEERDLLIVIDGGFSVRAVEAYLRELLTKANHGQPVPVFEFQPVTRRDKAIVLAREGIKEINVKSTMYAATDLQDRTKHQPDSVLAQLGGALRSLIEENRSAEQMEMLAEEWAHIQVSTIISAKGGSRAAEPVLESLEVLGGELLKEDTGGLEIIITTRDGTVIKGEDLIRVKSANLKRRENTNDLDIHEVWEKLTEYSLELHRLGEWLT